MCVSINKYGTGYRYIGEINNRLKIIGIYIYVHYTKYNGGKGYAKINRPTTCIVSWKGQLLDHRLISHTFFLYTITAGHWVTILYN